MVGRIKLGPNGATVAALGVGTWAWGERRMWGYGQAYGQAEVAAAFDASVAAGIDFFDTAEIYGKGESERLLGAFIRERGARVVVATKFAPYPWRFRARSLRPALMASLQRLGVARVDLYQIHFPYTILSINALMDALQRVGLVDQVGVSNYSLRRWRAAEHALGSRVVSNQVSYSLVARSPERDLLPFAESHDRMVIAYSPLAQGLLSGRYHRGNRPANRLRVASPLFLPDNLDRAGDLIATLREVADAHSATPAQVALAWVIHRPAVVAIPGAASVEQLESNVAAAEIKLGDDEYQALQAASDRFSPITGPAALPRVARARLGR